MKHRIAPLIGGFIFASALSLSAQTFTEDNSATPAANTFKRVDSYPIFAPNTVSVDDGIIFNNVIGGGVPDPYAINPIGITVLDVTTDSGTTQLYDICAELFVGPNGSSSYSLAEGFGSMNANQQVQVAKLLTNTLFDFVDAHEANDRSTAGIIGAAIQLALWEIIEDPNTAANLSLDTGSLSILGYSAGYSGDAKSSMELAETYLTSIDGWSDNEGITYIYGDPGSDQDRLWLATGVFAIPEPSTALFGLLSLGFLLRRKRI